MASKKPGNSILALSCNEVHSTGTTGICVSQLVTFKHHFFGVS